MPSKVNFPGQCLLCTRWLARLQTCLKLRNCSRNLTRTQMAPSVRRSSSLSLNKIKTYSMFCKIQLEHKSEIFKNACTQLQSLYVQLNTITFRIGLFHLNMYRARGVHLCTPCASHVNHRSLGAEQPLLKTTEPPSNPIDVLLA